MFGSWEGEDAAEEKEREERGRRGRRGMVGRWATLMVVVAAVRKMRGMVLSSMVLSCGRTKLYFGGRELGVERGMNEYREVERKKGGL